MGVASFFNVEAHDIMKPLKWSAGLHVIALVLVWTGIPGFDKREPIDISKPVIVDIIAPIDEKTAAPNTTKDRRDVAPPKPREKQSSSNPDMPEVKPSKSSTESFAPKSGGPENVKTPPKPETSKPTPPKMPDTISQKPEFEAQDKKPSKLEAQSQPKPQPQAEQQEPEEDFAPEQSDFTSVLKNLVGEREKQLAQQAASDVGNVGDNESDQDYMRQDAEENVTQQTTKAPDTANTITISEIDALQRQLARCWNIPVGARQADSLVVDLDVVVSQDRKVRSARIVNQRRYNNDSFFRSAADSARRALLSPSCSPLALPPDKHHLWREIRIRFDPREMFGN